MPLHAALDSTNSSSAAGRLRRNLRKYEWLVKAMAFAGSYALWTAVFKLLVLTLITYFLMPGSAGPGNPATGHFQEISDTYGSNEITLMGLSSLLFVLLLRFLNPITSTTSEEIFTPERLEKSFVPGFLHGGVLAAGVTLAFLLSGLYRYLGFFIRFEEAPLALAAVIMRVFSILALVYSEEYLFRRKLARYLSGHISDLARAGITALFYCGIKLLQFDLGWMHLLTLFLMSMTLSVRANSTDFARGAGYWAAVLIVFHPLLSLPVLGNEFSGILLVKYQGALADATDAGSGMSRFLSGGVGGPISSFAFQLLLVLDIIRGMLRRKKLASNPQ